jgi:hypothetical protein
LAPLLAAKGLTTGTIHRFQTGYETDQLLLANLGRQPRLESQGLLMIVEGWMPPLVDFLSYVKELRHQMPARAIIRIALVGPPKDAATKAVAPADMAIWQAKLEAIGDPYLEVFSLISDRSSS